MTAVWQVAKRQSNVRRARTSEIGGCWEEIFFYLWVGRNPTKGARSGILFGESGTLSQSFGTFRVAPGKARNQSKRLRDADEAADRRFAAREAWMPMALVRQAGKSDGARTQPNHGRFLIVSAGFSCQDQRTIF